jgi:hypothetical protein
MEKLLKMVGLLEVKRIALNLYKAMMRAKHLRGEGRENAVLPQVFCFYYF